MGRYSHPTARPQLDLKPPPFTSSDADPTETCFLWDFLNALGRHRTSENPVLLSLKGKHPSAILALADGTLWQGQSIGAPGTTVGEVVFNTAITGYQEILTDPSYCQQLVTLTYPHIGNVGTNAEDIESITPAARGLIVKQDRARPAQARAAAKLGTRHVEILAQDPQERLVCLGLHCPFAAIDGQNDGHWRSPLRGVRDIRTTAFKSEQSSRIASSDEGAVVDPASAFGTKPRL
jgi:hypothetical protein